jgi:hypothetical protein
MGQRPPAPVAAIAAVAGGAAQGTNEPPLEAARLAFVEQLAVASQRDRMAGAQADDGRRQDVRSHQPAVGSMLVRDDDSRDCRDLAPVAKLDVIMMFLPEAVRGFVGIDGRAERLIASKLQGDRPARATRASQPGPPDSCMAADVLAIVEKRPLVA